ncbi:MAG TPA: DUF6443 domain-containing protein [Niastella sp.]
MKRISRLLSLSYVHLLILLASCMAVNGYAQVTITYSSSCVARGSTQGYYLSGNWNSTTNIQWCVSGGIIVSNNSTCISGTPLPSIQVLWNGTGSTGSISANTNIGSSTVSINLYNPLNGATISSGGSQQIAANSIPATIICPAASGGGCGAVTYSYQWQQSTDNANWTTISGATGLNLSFSAGLTQTTYFRRSSTTSFVTAYSNTASVYVTAPLVPGTVTPVSQNVYTNVAADTLKGTAASGGVCAGNYQYQWQSADNASGPFTDIAGAANAWYKPSTIHATKYFRRRVICSAETGYTNTVAVNVFPILTSGALAVASGTITFNTSPGIITGAVTGGMCGGIYEYQWQQTLGSPSSYTDIPGATAADYTPGNLVFNTYFRRRVTCSGVIRYSDILITVMPTLQAGTIQAPVLNLLVNTSPGVITGATSTGGNCGGTYAYLWQRSVNAGVTWTNIANATSPDYSPGNQTATASYRRRTICGIETAYTNVITFVIYSGSPETVNRNFIRTRIVNKPLVTDAGAGYALTGVNDVSQVTEYFDGLGRLEQKVSKQQGTGVAVKDVVQPVQYDPYGREVFKYMSYASAGTDGNFKTNPLTEQQSYNAAQFPGESNFYTKTQYEAAPNGRVLKTSAPGASWTGSNRGVALQYETNKATDAVRIWNVTSTGTYTSTTAYAAGVLFKNITTNEDGKQLIEYKDKEDKVILRKIQAADTPSLNHAGWLCTYYVYDEYTNLSLVIQPKAVEWLVQNATWNLYTNTAIVPEFCFEYKYDRLNRLVEKRLPGAKARYIVYDRWDRIVLTQDAELRKTNKWIFTKYDGHDRPVITGFFTDNTRLTQAQMQAFADSSMATISRFEVRDNAKPNGYTTDRSFPVLTTPEYLSVAWFDDYTWCAAQGVSSAKVNTYDSRLRTASNSVYPYAQPLTQSTQVTGLQTGVKYYLLNSSGMANISVNFYDNNSRPLQIQTKHFAGGTDIITTQYDFSGKVISTHLRQQKGNPNTQLHEVITFTTYNHGGQVTKIEKRLISAIAGSKAQQTIATYEYNDLGTLKSKKLGQVASPIETQDLEYNVRGWITGINKDYVSGANTAKHFGLELGYDKATAVAAGASYQNLRYNGNASGTTWRSKGDGIARKYDYLYDNPNRLVRANFTQNTSGATWTNSVIDFSVYGAPEHGNNIGYDANGNILSLYQNAFKLTASAPIDKLHYTYVNSGLSNKLLAVTEDSTIGTARNKLGDFTDLNTTANDYTYNDNGNLVADKNKRITSVAYNHLNLPGIITFTDSTGATRGTIEYVYDASGNKLAKKVNETGRPLKTILYISGAQYNNDTLQLIVHEEGRIRYIKPVTGTVGSYEFDYLLQDNLGNTRMVLTEEVQTDPYTLLHFEGAAGSVPVQNQDVQYENRTGNSIAVTTARTTWPAAYKTYNPPAAGDTNEYAMLVKKSTGAIGAAKLLKVMAGDRLHVRVDYWYDVVNANNTGANGRQSIVSSLLTALGISNKPSGLIKGAVNTVTSTLNSDVALLSFLNAPAATNGANQAPKAYINVVFFNEQFKFDQASSRIFPVEYISDHLKRTISKFMEEAIPAGKNGYAYVYFSNETNESVYFDNFQVTHERGKILEETHYYPFGGRLEALCSQAFGKLPNQYQFGGKELQRDEFSNAGDPDGLQWLDFGARMYDPQIARWHTLDPKADEMRRWSPYNYAYDNPVRFTDPDGMDPNPHDLGVPQWVRYMANYALSKVNLPEKPNMGGSGNSGEQKAQQAFNQILDKGLKAMEHLKPVFDAVEKVVKTTGEIVSSFIPFADAAKEAYDGNYGMAGVYAATDLLGGSLERGAAKTTMKMAEKAMVKEVEQQVMKEAVQITSLNLVEHGNNFVKAGIEYEQYALRAADDGLYPVMQRGFAEPQGWVDLKKGDVWKYGTTKNPETRYSQSFLDNIGAGLYYHTEFTGTLAQVLQWEKNRILDYRYYFGVLPAGNKMVK